MESRLGREGRGASEEGSNDDFHLLQAGNLSLSRERARKRTEKDGDIMELVESGRIKLENVARTMKNVFLRMWSVRNILYFVGSVTVIHVFGDELAV